MRRRGLGSTRETADRLDKILLVTSMDIECLSCRSGLTSQLESSPSQVSDGWDLRLMKVTAKRLAAPRISRANADRGP